MLGCGGPPAAFVEHMAAGDRATSAGRHAEAAAQYEAAAAEAKRPRVREHARYLSAMLWVRAGDAAKGARMLGEIARGTGEHAPEAALRLALLHAQTEDASAEFQAVIERWPSSGSARVALQKLLAADDAKGAALARLEEMAQGPLGSSELGERIAYERALRLDRAGRALEARDAFVQVAARWPYPKGALFDDALWRASEADEKLGRVDEAIADLERMVAVRETAHFSGSYERPRFPAALLRIAVLYRDGKKDRARARAEFRRAFTSLAPTSPLRDDALWQEAALSDDPCGPLAELVSATPHSRYVPCAVERCPRISRPKESEAPAECRAYIKR